MTNDVWPVPIDENHYQLSYRIIETGGRTQHNATTLAEAIRVAGEAVKTVVWTGWSMFYQFSRKEIAPRIVIDRSTGDEVEAIESDLRSETYLETTVPDFWRITVDGRAVIIRPYREDRSADPRLQKRGLEPGAWLSPRVLVREVYEFATHAKELAKAFTYADMVEFRCSWIGLYGRRIGAFTPGTNWHERVCHVNERTTATTVSIERLTADTTSVVDALTAPVLRLFGALELGQKWITKKLPSFKTL